jgi:hypothetical protein
MAVAKAMAVDADPHYKYLSKLRFLYAYFCRAAVVVLLLIHASWYALA